MALTNEDLEKLARLKDLVISAQRAKAYIDGKISPIEALIGAAGGDGDNLINTVREVIAYFSGIPETDTLAATLLQLNTAINNRYTKTEVDDILEDTPEAVIDEEGQEAFLDAYQQALQAVYQAITDAQNAKADYVGDDNYVYRWDATQGKYVKTDKYVKGADGAPGTTDYNELANKPTRLSQFTDDLGTNPTHTHASLVDGGSYNSTTKMIELKHGNTVLATIDATAFIKDGMVSDVSIINGSLVIAFNTDSGKQPISIPLTDIFNPSNYYTKTDTNALLAAKANTEDLPNCDTVIVGAGEVWPF